MLQCLGVSILYSPLLVDICSDINIIFYFRQNSMMERERRTGKAGIPSSMANHTLENGRTLNSMDSVCIPPSFFPSILFISLFYNSNIFRLIIVFEFILNI